MDPYLIIFIITLLPWIELRGAVPIGILVFGLDPVLVFIISLLGNIAVIFPIYFGLESGYSFIRRFDLVRNMIERAREKGKRLDGRNGFIGLALFVAIPLPVTGAWTGTLIAWVLHLDRKRAFLAIAAGVTLAAILVTALSLIAGEVIFNWLRVSRSAPI